MCTFIGVAGIYFLLQAEFLAVVQVLIYVGAITVLIIFAIMLTRRVLQDTGPKFNANWGWAAFVAAVLFGALVWVMVNWPGISSPMAELSERKDTLQQLGAALVSPSSYVLPFDLASVLLLAALIGSIFIAREKN